MTYPPSKAPESPRRPALWPVAAVAAELDSDQLRREADPDGKAAVLSPKAR